MDIRAIVEGLSAYERKTLLSLQGLAESTVAEVERSSDLDHPTVMRAALGLSQKGLVRVLESKSSIATLTEEGKSYALEGLPERRVLKALDQVKATPEPQEFAGRAGLTPDQARISLGWLCHKGWAEFVKEAGRNVLRATSAGEAALEQTLPDERLLADLARVGRLGVGELSPDRKRVLDELRRRKLVEVEERVDRRLIPTELGKRALELGIELVEEFSELTHELLVTGRWREAKFKRYDVRAEVAPVYPGKVHPQQQVIDELREILLEMGFVEIESNLVESEFWNFDVLFQAQDHPAREIHDSLSLSKPNRTRLPSRALVKRVAVAHERGTAGSTGWGYKFDFEVSRRPVLCSQTTAATVRYLASHPKPPVKVFCIDRVYRHERIDYKHLAEFYQCEGIVMDPGLTLRDMFGYLKQIVVKLRLPEIRFRPGYFPYTEPSVEADVYFSEKREWLEVLGAGMFRPELLRPLGIRHPVLAWGIGFSRLAMIRLGIEDIRDLFGNDLEWLQARGLV